MRAKRLTVHRLVQAGVYAAVTALGHRLRTAYEEGQAVLASFCPEAKGHHIPGGFDWPCHAKSAGHPGHGVAPTLSPLATLSRAHSLRFQGLHGLQLVLHGIQLRFRFAQLVPDARPHENQGRDLLAATSQLLRHHIELAFEQHALLLQQLLAGEEGKAIVGNGNVSIHRY